MYHGAFIKLSATESTRRAAWNLPPNLVSDECGLTEMSNSWIARETLLGTPSKPVLPHRCGVVIKIILKIRAFCQPILDSPVCLGYVWLVLFTLQQFGRLEPADMQNFLNVWS
jgi:hypothetical protein